MNRSEGFALHPPLPAPRQPITFARWDLAIFALVLLLATFR